MAQNQPTPLMTDDLFPSLDERVQRRIAENLREHFGGNAPCIPAERWDALKPILAAYKRDAEFFRGFLNKGQAAKLRKVAQTSKKLLSALEEADTAGVSKSIGDRLENLTLEAIQEALGVLAKELEIETRDEPFLEDRSRENLYRNFGIWWQHTTGQAPRIEEGIEGHPPPTPFMFVANEVFSLPGMPQPTGASYKSLKDQRRKVNARSEKITRLGEMLNDIELRSSGQGGKGHKI